MIVIAQAGQAGKTGLLFDMHRLRARVFKDTLKWNVDVDANGLEVDQFDLPEAVYLLSLDTTGRVRGSWRLLPSTGPTMIRDLWPQYLETLPFPPDDNVYEVSRFSVSVLEADPDKNAAETQETVAEMFCGLTELCIHAGITGIQTLYDDRIATVIERIDCVPYATSTRLPVGDLMCRTGAFRTDAAMLERLRRRTGISHTVLDTADLQPLMTARCALWTETKGQCHVAGQG